MSDDLKFFFFILVVGVLVIVFLPVADSAAEPRQRQRDITYQEYLILAGAAVVIFLIILKE